MVKPPRKPSILRVFCHRKALLFEIDKASDIPPQHAADLSGIHTGPNPFSVGPAATDTTSRTRQQPGIETTHSLNLATPGLVPLSPSGVGGKTTKATHRIFPGKACVVCNMVLDTEEGLLTGVTNMDIIESLEGKAGKSFPLHTLAVLTTPSA